MAGVGIGALLIVATAVLIGAMTQTSVGLGLGLVSAPFMTIVTPSLMPGTLIMLAATLPFFTLIREHRDIDWFGLGWSMPWRMVGTVAGVWIITQVTTNNLERIVGVVVLLGVLLTARAVVVPINRGTLGAAGFVSGVTGTATSIGGPPFVLLYQHRPPHQIRSTVAIFFSLGAILSLVGLGIADELTFDEVKAAGILIPMLAMGVLAGTRLRTRLPLSVMRPALLVVSGASAVVLIVRSFV